MHTISSRDLLSRLQLGHNLTYAILQDPRLAPKKKGNLRFYTLPNLLAVMRDRGWFTPAMEADLIQLDHSKRKDTDCV